MDFRTVAIHQIINLSPNIRRIIFSGESLNNFPENYETAHVKIIVLKESEFQNFTFSPKEKSRMRSYTIKKFNTKKQKLTIDFVINEHKGLITDWATNAKIGDHVAIGGPGVIKYKNLNAKWHLLIGQYYCPFLLLLPQLKNCPKMQLALSFYKFHLKMIYKK